MIGPIIRRAWASDLEALTAYIARANAEPSRQCLHTPGASRQVIRSAILRDGGLDDPRRMVFALATEAGEISAALGCQFGSESDVGWLWGPWASTAHGWKKTAPSLLEELLGAVPSGVRRLDAFLQSANREGLGFLERHGFGIRSATHIYVAPLDARLTVSPAPTLRELTSRYEVGFARLHRETFPAAESASAEDLLASRDGEHVIFVAADGLRLDGYICFSVNAAPREGFIEYLAVRPAVRGRGIGQSLLQTALAWASTEKHLPQAALCVTAWRDDARRLYERAGFRLSATGRGARRHLR